MSKWSFAHRVLASYTSAFLMLGVPIVDTSESFLTLWASFPASLLPQVDAMKALAPQHIMKVTPERAWIPLWKEQADAVSRVKDMCKELDIEYTDTTEVALVKVVFSPLGFGHYYLKGNVALLGLEPLSISRYAAV